MTHYDKRLRTGEMSNNHPMQLSKNKWTEVNDFLLSVSSVDSIEELNSRILNEIPALIPFEKSGILIGFGNNYKPKIEESINLEKSWNDLFNNYYNSFTVYPAFEKNVFLANHREIQKNAKSEFYNNFLIPLKIKYSIGFIISAEGNNPSHALVLNRTASEHMYTDDEMNIMKIIQPHISNYYRMLSLLGRFRKIPVLISELEEDNSLLSARESEVIHFLLQRLKPADIAKELKISILTVRKHIQNIYDKLNVMDRKQLYQKIHLDFKKTDNVKNNNRQ
jgi:DNA-binding CsgD family transcriptional regulator